MHYNENHPLIWNLAKRLVDLDGPWPYSFMFVGSAVVAAIIIRQLFG